nr:immunoglobulin light chain junction region [Macaca mulatta]MOV81931.1 immunoglobulin light chain junction region [Macaca mulatta]MOV82665.1 immunoglobulin light chain junction region [Macaca mulatta]MOV84595.1 immunoglobulin light chain junction region [Macaca mulatta]MOV85958.1 immunoglobulin light chain junction region [Macaca mulatta]
CYQYTGGYTF